MVMEMCIHMLSSESLTGFVKAARVGRLNFILHGACTKETAYLVMTSKHAMMVELQMIQSTHQGMIQHLAGSARPHCCSTCPIPPSVKPPCCPLASAAIPGVRLERSQHVLAHAIVMKPGKCYH
eukprot:6198531-Pleurochrysis_carterae.AAC.2